MVVTIVGQGVAGTLLAFELERRGIDFQIIDSGENHSSSVAAGIMNPVVFRRLTKSWLVDSCWDLAIETYQELTKKLGVSFFHGKPMRRLFASEQEVGYWDKKTQDPSFQNFISKYNLDEPIPNYVKNTFGCGLVNTVYHVDVIPFLNSTRAYFIDSGRLRTENVDYFNVYEEMERGKTDFVVFSQGYRNFENPFFNKLPVQTTKGQILLVKNDEINQNELLNRKCFMLPIGENLFRVGATYEWENTSLHTTEDAKLEISEKLKSLIHLDFEVVSQQAGIRPTTPDRRPIIGAHPEYQNMFILNGLGTKGYLLAPWCVQHLCDHIFENKPLLHDVDLKRFKML